MPRKARSLRSVDPKKLETRLARERNPWLRKRIRTVLALLHGCSPREAAKKNGVSIGSARRWQERVRVGGLRALLVHDHGVKQRNTILPKLRSDSALQAAISAALTADRYPPIRNLLTAAEAIMHGAAVAVAARIYDVPRTTLGRALRLLHQGGLPALLAHSYVRLDQLDASKGQGDERR